MYEMLIYTQNCFQLETFEIGHNFRYKHPKRCLFLSEYVSASTLVLAFEKVVWIVKDGSFIK